MSVGVSTAAADWRRFLAPLALAQFICSFAGSNMNVMITDISEDLDTTVEGVQAAITLFLLIMAILMIPGSKLTDRWGRKRCLTAGLVLYGIGALISALSPSLGLPILGNSVFEGVGTALLIPPVYILTTLHFGHLGSRARAFGVISGMAASAPRLRGVRDPAGRQRRRADGGVPGRRRRLPARVLPVHPCSRARGQGAAPVPRPVREPHVHLGLVTQDIQWLILMGTSFVVAGYLQAIRGYNAIETGVVFTAATVGILVSSLAAERLARKHPQRTPILAGFVATMTGIGLLLALVGASSRVVAFVPGLLLIGLGLGVMLTPLVNVVQSSFPGELQGEISGLSRSVSNLGSSFGAGIAGTILVSDLASGNSTYVVAMVVLAALAFVGLAAAARLPHGSEPAVRRAPTGAL